MKNFKLLTILSLTLLFSANSFVFSYCIDTCSGCYLKKNKTYKNYYSQDNNFCAYKSDSSDSVFVENVLQAINIFEFKNVVSFSFSSDSKYLLVERSEYNAKLNMQNDFIEIFDMANEKRIFYMPFYKKCYPSAYYADKSYNLDNLVYLDFSGNTLRSIEWDFEGNIVNVPAYLYSVNSVYVSQLGLGLSVKYNDGSMKVYLPKKDFSGLNILASFGQSILASDMISWRYEEIYY